MKDRPMLFTGPMVRALLDGSKTQTRRVISADHLRQIDLEKAPCFANWSRPMPYGQPGNQLWVRETFFAWGRWETRFSAKKGRDEWHFVDMTLEFGHQYAYPADGYAIAPRRRTCGVLPSWWKRPAIFMPRAASRITLEISGVRVERLYDITADDCIAEGIVRLPDGGYASSRDGKNYHAASAWFAYASLWESINGPGSWESKPWVWVIEFKRLKP